MAFIASISKCVVMVPRHRTKAEDFSSEAKFTINGAEIEYVNSWPHLGHLTTDNMDDEKDIDRARHKLIGQVNSVLCTFRKLDPLVKLRLLRNYCMTLYGCQLWHLRHTYNDNICKSWRSGMKSASGLHNILSF